MSFNRSEILVARCLREISRAGLTSNADDICDELTNVQKQLCLNYFALPKEITLKLESGKEKYDLQGKVYKLRSYELPSSWTTKVNFVTSPEEYIGKKIDAASYPEQPTLMMVHDNYLKIYYPPSTSGEELTIYIFAQPSGDITEDDEPELDPVWDDALFYGTLTNMFIEGDWENKFEKEARKRMADVGKPTAQVMKRQSFIDEIGF